MGLTPVPMMDRARKSELPENQVSLCGLEKLYSFSTAGQLKFFFASDIAVDFLKSIEQSK